MVRAEMNPNDVVARVRKSVRLQRYEREDGKVAWLTVDRRKKGGHGPVGTEAEGRSDHEKQIMFRALKRIDPKHDWHEYDWHTLSGPAEARVAQMLAWREECDEARRELAPFQALVGTVIRSAQRQRRGR